MTTPRRTPILSGLTSRYGSYRSAGIPDPYHFFGTFAGLPFWGGGLTLLSTAPSIGKTSWMLRMLLNEAAINVPPTLGCYEHTDGELKFRVFGDNPWHVLALTVAVIWGSFQSVPIRLAFPLVFYPMALPILLVGLSVRRNLVGRTDLFALGTISFPFPISAVIADFVGFEFWRRWWVQRGNNAYIPAIPGMFLGLAVHGVVQMYIQYFV